MSRLVAANCLVSCLTAEWLPCPSGLVVKGYSDPSWPAEVVAGQPSSQARTPASLGSRSPILWDPWRDSLLSAWPGPRTIVTHQPAPLLWVRALGGKCPQNCGVKGHVFLGAACGPVWSLWALPAASPVPRVPVGPLLACPATTARPLLERPVTKSQTGLGLAGLCGGGSGGDRNTLPRVRLGPRSQPGLSQGGPQGRSPRSKA